MNKKAEIETTTKWVIMIIIAIILLLLLFLLIRSLFGEASIKIEEKLREFVVPPTAVISSPSPSDIYKVFDPITFDGSESYDQFHKIVGYYWDFDGDYIIDSK